jgi:hypothetical protein
MNATARRPHALLACAGAVLVAVSSIAASDGGLLVVPFVLWALAPWAGVWIMGGMTEDDWTAAGAAAAALAVEAGVRAAVFVWPRGSTAAVALVFSPAAVAIAAVAGAALGWAAGRLWRWGTAGRLLVVPAATALLGLVFLGLARPELFPTTVARRRAALERIGAPRVAAGADAFERTLVAEKDYWTHAGDLDGRPGEELVLATHARAEWLDPATLKKTGEADYSSLTPATWSWYSRLTRVGGRTAIAQTGGGFSDTKLLSLDGETLWEYRPNPSLAPDALRPADLDGDGRAEFYSSYSDAVVRLDEDGKEAWRLPASGARLVALAPREGAVPGWVVAVEYGRRTWVLDEAGKTLAELPDDPNDSVVTVVDHAAGRALVRGGAVARGFDLGGKLLFETPLPDMALSAAATARFAPDAPPHAALVAAADRDTKRWRALLVAPNGAIVYDEVSDAWLKWLAVRKADGTHELFLTRSGRIERLRPRPR